MKWSRYLRIFVASLTLGLTVVTAIPAAADTIAQSFQADTTIPPGWVVALKNGSSTNVELSPANHSERIYGVVIDPSQAPATLQRQSNQQVFVAINGEYPVLVSTQNGPINVGDYLSISSNAGIAAKAISAQPFVLGRASQKFDGTSGVLSSGNGSSVGKVSATILPQKNPLLKNDVAIPEFIRSVGDSIAGREVVAIRIYAGMAVFIIAAVMALGVLITGIRTAMVSIGRNPLSKASILRGLIQVIGAAVIVLILGLTSVYLLLRL